MVKEFTIDRSKWLRGEGSSKSSLLREDDEKMCCLGFYSLACGVSEETILGKIEVESDFPEEMNILWS